MVESEAKKYLVAVLSPSATITHKYSSLLNVIIDEKEASPHKYLDGLLIGSPHRYGNEFHIFLSFLKPIPYTQSCLKLIKTQNI